MPYTKLENIKDQGFTRYGFAVADESEFDALITQHLEDQIALITIDFPAYASATSTQQIILAQAEKYKTAAALTRVKIHQGTNDAYRDLNGQPANDDPAYKVAQRFENQADIWLAKLGLSKQSANEGPALASGVVVSE